MARNRGGGGQGRPVRGFRPGKEPAQLRKQRAKAQLGSEGNWAQKRMIDTFGDRTPNEIRAMMKRWRAVIIGLAAALAVLGAFLYGWSVVAGLSAHILALGLFFVWFQLLRKRAQFEAMADLVGRKGKR